MTLVLTEEPAVEPVTAEQVKLDASIDGCESDALIDMLITTARRDAEKETGRALITQTWQLILDGFPDCDICINKLPIQSITSIKYYDNSNVQQTLSSSYYALDNKTAPGFARLNYGYSWPSTYQRFDAVEIEFVAGYGDAPTDVPDEFRMWIRLHAAYEADKGKGQVTITDFIARILDPYRLYHV